MKAAKSGTIRFIEPMYALAVENIPEARNGSMKSSLTVTAAWLAEARTEYNSMPKTV